MESLPNTFTSRAATKLSSDTDFLKKLQCFRSMYKQRNIIMSRVTKYYRSSIRIIENANMKHLQNHQNRFDQSVHYDFRIFELTEQIAAARNVLSMFQYKIDCTSQNLNQLNGELLQLQNYQLSINTIAQKKVHFERPESSERARCFHSIIKPVLSTVRTYLKNLSLEFARYWYFNHYESSILLRSYQTIPTIHSTMTAQSLLLAILVDIYSKFLSSQHCSNAGSLRREWDIDNVCVRKLITSTATEICPYLSEAGWRQLMTSENGLDIFFETLCEEFLRCECVRRDLDINELLNTLCERQYKQLQDWDYVDAVS